MKNSLQLLMTLQLVMSILGEHQTRLPEQFKASYDAGKIKVMENVNYLRKQVIVGAGTVELLDANTAKIKGISDYDKNQLSADTVQIITDIRVGYDATQTAVGKEALLTYQSALPASVRSARLIIKQGGSVVYSMPLADLNNVHTGNNNQDDYLSLAIPVVLVGNIDTNFDIEFPVGATPDATNKEYFELAFKGYETRRSAA